MRFHDRPAAASACAFCVAPRWRRAQSGSQALSSRTEWGTPPQQAHDGPPTSVADSRCACRTRMFRYRPDIPRLSFRRNALADAGAACAFAGTSAVLKRAEWGHGPPALRGWLVHPMPGRPAGGSRQDVRDHLRGPDAPLIPLCVAQRRSSSGNSQTGLTSLSI